jgi:hypothetical protein
MSVTPYEIKFQSPSETSSGSIETGLETQSDTNAGCANSNTEVFGPSLSEF